MQISGEGSLGIQEAHQQARDGAAAAGVAAHAEATDHPRWEAMAVRRLATTNAGTTRRRVTRPMNAARRNVMLQPTRPGWRRSSPLCWWLRRRSTQQLLPLHPDPRHRGLLPHPP
ncbi:hypothetical protein SEVIR_8G241601v4 [Setaria viridis]